MGFSTLLGRSGMFLEGAFHVLCHVFLPFAVLNAKALLAIAFLMSVAKRLGPKKAEASVKRLARHRSTKSEV